MSSTSTELPSGGASPSSEFDLFIVHADADRAWVDGYLKHALGLEPARVMTPRDFRLGASVIGEFERGVTSSRFTLLVLSPSFLTDRWTVFGEGLVSFSSVDEGRNRLLALTLHPCQVPLRLRFRESLDCTDWTNWDDEAARLRRHLDAPEPVLEAIPCPYPGMVPFKKEDARFFHGRDAEIRNLLTLIRQHHFLAVIGSSGSGKSSLITAGLFPKLEDPRNFARGTWCVLTMRPGAAPTEELARVLDGVTDDLAGAISRTLAAEPSAQRLLLLVDQFEELFSQVKEAPRRDAFIGHLKALRADPRCTIVLTMRADFYGDLMNSALWPIDKSQIVEVAALRGESLRQAIVKPAEAVGVYLEDRLVDRLLADAADEPGSLPMLQEALVLLWGTMSGRLLTRASYDTLGHDGRSGLAVAMATKADATLAALPHEQQRMARRIFLRLVQFGEGRPDTRRQLGVDDLRAESDDPAAFDELLQHLIANRLLTPSPDEARGLRVDIAHEMLIVGWPASRDWVESRREAEKARRRLVAKAEEWVRLGRAESGLLDPGELAEADTWLKSPDAMDLGIDLDVNALAEVSRKAIELRKRLQRRRTQTAIGALTSALLVISILAVWGDFKRRDADTQRLEALDQKKKADDSKTAADNERAKAISEKEFAERMARISHSQELAALSALDRNRRLDRSLLLAVESVRTADTLEARRSLYEALQHKAKFALFLHVNEGDVTSVTLSPDGRTLAAGYINGNGGGMVVWDITARNRLSELRLPKELSYVSGVAFSPDGKAIAIGFRHPKETGVGSGGVIFWDVTTRKVLSLSDYRATPITCVAFSPDNQTLVLGEERAVSFWDVASRRILAAERLDNEVSSLAFSSDGKTLAAGFGRGNGGGVVLWDVAGRKWLVAGPLVVGEGAVTSVAFSPDGKTLAAAFGSGDRGGVKLWDTSAWKLLGTGPVGEGAVTSVAFSPDGKTLVAAFGGGSGEGGAVLWDAAARQRLAAEPLTLGEEGFSSIALSRDGKTLAAGFGRGNRGGNGGGGVALWDTAAGQRLATGSLAVGEGPVSTVAFSSDGKTLAAGFRRGDRGGGVVLWDTASRQRLAAGPLAVGEGEVTSVDFNPDGKTLAAGFGHIHIAPNRLDRSGGVVLWDAAKGQRLAAGPLAVGEGEVTSVDFSPDGKTLAAGFGHRNHFKSGVVLWDAGTRQRLATEPLIFGGTSNSTVAFGADGKSFAVGIVNMPLGRRSYSSVGLWDASGRQRLPSALLDVKEDEVFSVVFGPDGNALAAGFVRDSGGGVVLLDAAARQLLAMEPLLVGEGAVTSVAFSPDGKILAVGFGRSSNDGGVVLWDAAVRQRLAAKYLPMKGAVSRLSFSPDGKTLAVGFGRGSEGGVILWDVDPESWQRLAGRIANRNFTRDEWLRYFPEHPYRRTFADLPIEPETSPKSTAKSVGLSN